MCRPPQEEPKPHHRQTPGERRTMKSMACVGAVSSLEPFVRTADDILDEVLRDKRAKDRPQPHHEHVWAEMTREVSGEPPVTAKDGVFCRIIDELTLRTLILSGPGGMPTSSWACCRVPRTYEHAHEDVGMPPGHPAIARIRGMVSMFSKRSSEWSVKSWSSLTGIDTPKTVEDEHRGPWYIVRYGNPPMVLNPLGNQELHPNSRTNDAADPMIILGRCAFPSLASRGEISIIPGSRRDHGEDGTPRRRKRLLRKRRSRRRARVAPKKARAPNDVNHADRSQEHRPKPSATIKAYCADRSQFVDRSHLHQSYCVAPSEANRAERSRPL